MPHLDFLTLYIVIFLNSLTVSVVWGAFAYRYRPHPAARSWLAACILSLAGGAVLAVQGNAGAVVPAIAGNTIIVFGFLQFWIGLRRFHGLRGGQGTAAAITLVAAACMIFFHDNDRARSIVYAASQAVVMSMCAWYLLRTRPLALGAVIAGVAFLVALFGQLMVVGGNVGVLLDAMAFPTFYTLASYALLCTIFSGSVWNLGFAILTIDKLQRELGRLSETDELTGLANRRALRRAVEEEHRRAVESGMPYSVMLIDLNDFKPLNDTYGHAAGDRALVAVAEMLTASVRRSDVVARLGGDEFCIVLPATAHDAAMRLAEGVRQQFRSRPLRIGDKDVRLSAGIGVAEWRPEAHPGPDAVIAAADRQLYGEKALPRSRSRPVQHGLQLVVQS